MKILHLYKDYYPVLGGIENHIRILAEAQAAAGHEVTVLVCSPTRRTVSEVRNGVRVVKSGRLGTVASMPISLRQPVAFLGERPDIVHVHSPYPLGEVSAWLLKRGVPFVITHHSDVVRQKRLLKVYGHLLRRVLRSASRIIATSPRYIDTSPWLGPVRERCCVVPLCVDTTRFVPAEELTPGPLSLLFVGRFRYYKGLDTVLQALTLMPDADLVAVGDGPRRSEWEGLAQQLGLGDRVRFVGAVDDQELPGWFQRANAYVLSANVRAEAFGIALLEAMASGLPCVTTEVGTGTSWVVQDGVTGWVVPPTDPPALAEALKRLQDGSLRQQMGKAGRKRVEAHFTRERMIDQVMQVYGKVLG